jgi:hypothetical protein
VWAAAEWRCLSEHTMAQLGAMTLTTQEVDHTELLTA